VSSAEAAQKAVETLDKQELDGRQVIVEIAKPADQKDQEKKEKKAKRKPGRRGSKAVPGEVTEAEANGETKAEAVAPSIDEAAKPKKKKKNNRKPKRTPAEGEEPSADATPQAEGDAPKRIRTKRARAPRVLRAEGEDPLGEPSKTMLFVANLGFNTDDAALGALFTQAGIDVVSARIVRRRWGQPRKSKGYGFVDVGSEEEQKKAIAALDNKDVGGRNIAVKIAVNTPHEDEGEGADTSAVTPEATIVAS